MKELSSCKQAITDCLASQTFSIAHLYQEEKAMDMHIHDCYELYYSISGGKQFLIDNRFYTISPGDLFVINQYESHKLTQIDSCVHERIVLSIHPDYLKKLSTPLTDLDLCFSCRTEGRTHKVSLSREQQQRFLYLINKITSASGFAHDITEQAAFMELMALISYAWCSAHESETAAAKAVSPLPATHGANGSVGANGTVGAMGDESSPHSYRYSQQVEDILSYINRNLSEPITIEQLAAEFFLSKSYICRIFKAATGTTISKYITARRISITKSLLNEGCSVAEAYEQSGFHDYSSFFKAFTKAVGISPKKYASLSIS